MAAIHAEGIDTPGPFSSAIVELHGGYRAQHVHHTPPDPLVDDTVTWQMALPHLLRVLVFVVVPSIVGWFLIAIASVITAVSAATQGLTGTSSGGAGWGVLALVFALVLFVLAVVVLFLPLKEPISEYSQIVEERAEYQEPAYWWVMRAARHHQLPIAPQATRLGGAPVMMFSHDRLHAMLVVKPYGRHLYVGWTMWRARSTMLLIGHFLRDTFARWSPQAQARAEDRGNDARAMRELVHSVSREGVQAAIFAHTMAGEHQATPHSIHDELRSLPEYDPAPVYGGQIPGPRGPFS